MRLMLFCVSFMSSFSLDQEAKGKATKEDIPRPSLEMKFLLSMRNFVCLLKNN
jgi:hypothetical protein